MPDRRQVMVERLAWATMVPAKAISRTFVGCGRGDLLPLTLRSIGCAQCWLDWLVSRDKEVNNQRNLLIQNHRVAKSVHEILPLKYFGFSITSK